jgi:hypothetical protein
MQCYISLFLKGWCYIFSQLSHFHNSDCHCAFRMYGRPGVLSKQHFAYFYGAIKREEGVSWCC